MKPASAVEFAQLASTNQGMMRLVSAVQELSLARNLETIMAIVRRAARELTGADGATFVLKDQDRCHYADEDAIAPLWKGQRFPMSACISGWAMMNRKPAVVEDIYDDPRIPAHVYRPTFVKSLAIVPIRSQDPIGAIGNYWAKHHLPTAQEVELLQALANTTAVALENVRIYSELEQRVQERTAQLEAANRELEAFSYAVSHDLGTPLRHISGFAEILDTSCGDKLDESGKQWVGKIRASTRRMHHLVNNLLRLSKVSRVELTVQRVSLSMMAKDIAGRFIAESPDRKVTWIIPDTIEAEGDPALMEIAVENLLSNAWKYTAGSPEPRIELGVESRQDGAPVFFVRDNGAGFDMARATHLFQPFQRLHNSKEFPGSGVGLATVQRIIQRHGGKIWVDAALGKGATFFFTLSPDHQG